MSFNKLCFFVKIKNVVQALCTNYYWQGEYCSIYFSITEFY